MIRVRRGAIALAGFALLGLVAELCGRNLTQRLDAAVHVGPLTTPTTSYYPFLLAGLRIVAALTLAGLGWRVLRAIARAGAGERALAAVGGRTRLTLPALKLRLSPKVWASSFASTSLWFLVQNDGARVVSGGAPSLAPWLHTFALPVFAVVSIALGLALSAVYDWVRAVEEYAETVLAYASRLLRRRSLPANRLRPVGVRAPRWLFGRTFDSRPPPLPL